MARKLIPDPPRGLRERPRADGSTRIWWEPPAAAASAGFKPVELDETKLTWSRGQAEKLNRDADRALRNGGRKQPARGGRTISALIDRYRRDEEFTGKADATRKSYAGFLRIIDEKWGPVPAIDFDKPTLREWYLTNKRHRGATAAMRINAMFSILFSFAELIGWRPEDSNPCRKLKITQPPARKRVGSWPEIDALLDSSAALAMPAIGTAVLLAVLQGQRQTDILAAACEDFPMVAAPQGDVLTWRVDRSKTGALGLMQLHPLVAGRVEALIEARIGTPLRHGDPLPPRDACHALLTDDTLGRPFDTYLFGKRWRQVRAHAAQEVPSVATLKFRDLRRTFGVWSRAGGASDDDTADVLGNSANIDPRLQETYMPPSFETASRAVLAIQRPERKRA